jgi:hypothetical protein
MLFDPLRRASCPILAVTGDSTGRLGVRYAVTNAPRLPLTAVVPPEAIAG